MAGILPGLFRSPISVLYLALTGTFPDSRPDGTHPAGNPVSPFNSTDLPLVEFPLPDLTISNLVYIWGRPAEQQPSTMWKEESTWTL
jgi:hypothetical protein